MSGQEEKRIIVKVAYNYFQDGKWDLALAEYEKLALIDPMDFLVHNMMAEIYIRRGDIGDIAKAVEEYSKAAKLLYVTNNIDKAIHAYMQILKHNPQHPEAKVRIEELVETKLTAIAKLVEEGNLEEAHAQCRRLSFKVPEMTRVDEKLEQIENLLEEKVNQDNTVPRSWDIDQLTETAPKGNQSNDELIKNLIQLAQTYEQKESWDEAIENYLTVLRFKPDDEGIKEKLNSLYAKITPLSEEQPPVEETPIIQPIEVPIEQLSASETDQINEMITPSPGNDQSTKRPGPLPKADLRSTFEEMEQLRLQAEERLKQAVRERREREQRRIDQSSVQEEKIMSSVDQKAIDKERDLQALLTQAQIYIKQNVLVEALRICQRILEFDATNREVRHLLKKIYDKKIFS